MLDEIEIQSYKFTGCPIEDKYYVAIIEFQSYSRMDSCSNADYIMTVYNKCNKCFMFIRLLLR